MREYIIGVDGGGTKTHYALFDLQGKLVNFATGGTASHEFLEDGYEGTRRTLSAAISKLCEPSRIKPGEIKAGMFGLAGLDIDRQRIELDKVIKQIGIEKYSIANDAFLGIKAGTEKGYGACIVNGTGTCCAGIDRTGRWLKLGGTGEAMGDEASSRSIGKSVIRSVYDYFYRCGQKTCLTEMLFNELTISSGNDLINAVYDKIYSGGIRMHAFCRLAFLAANKGDEAALSILRHAGREMALTVVGLIKQLDFSTEEEIEVVMAGSVNVKAENPMLADTFKKTVNEELGKKVKYVLLKEPPVMGAVLWALEMAGSGNGPRLKEKIANCLDNAYI